MKPILIEDSKIPVWLSYISPIEIKAITLFPFVLARGKMDHVTINHESIHFQQCLETLVIGFYILYLIDYIHGLIVHGSSEEAYYYLRAEQEAYANEINEHYLLRRRRYDWLFNYTVGGHDDI